MKTASLECQIAREQLKRYLGGVKLAPELVRGLERHLASCPECLAAARKGRPETASKPTAAAKKPASAAKKKMPGFAVVDAAKAAAGKPLADKKKATTRTAVLGTLLVLTLAAMGAISRNPEGMLGKRAIVAEARVPKPEPVAAETNFAPEPLKGDPMPMVAIEEPVVETPVEPPVKAEVPPQKKPIVRATVERKATTSRPVNRRTTRRPTTRSNAPAKSDSGSIRVYDASGRPINP